MRGSKPFQILCQNHPLLFAASASPERECRDRRLTSFGWGDEKSMVLSNYLIE